MLILDREVGESVDLYDRPSGRRLATIKLTRLRAADNKAVLGFDAPQNVQIVRSELKLKGCKDAEHTNK